MSTPPDAFSDEHNTREGSREAEQATSDKQAAEASQGEAQSSPVSPEETTLPPAAQGETHGGPLGCCLGMVVGIFLMALLTTGIPLLVSPHGLPGTIALPLSLIAAIPCGFLGWQVGKRIYREYELSSRQKQKLAAWERRKAAQEADKRQR